MNTSLCFTRTSSRLTVCAGVQWAAEEGHIGCVALMLRSALKKSDLANALLAAAKHGHEHIVHLLVEAGEWAMHMQCTCKATLLYT